MIPHKASVIIQARVDSIRFPNKILKKIGNTSAIEFLLKRVKRSKYVDKVIVAIPKNNKNNFLFEFLKKKGEIVFQGSSKNVLNRYYSACKKYNCKNIVRITGDCPFVDPKLVDKCIQLFFKNKVDYLSNVFPPTFPDGLDVEIFSKKVLEKIIKKKLTKEHKEHVTSYIRENYSQFKILNLKNNKDLSNIRITLDTEEDLIRLVRISRYLKNNIYFDWKKILKNKDILKQLKTKKQKQNRNLGMKLSDGQKLWTRAKKIIPGGNMLLSKRGDRFLPNYWPNYFIKAKKCFVWDLDKKKYVDMSLMGVGTNILGYSNKKIEKAITQIAKNGNMTTLNCPEEVYLAEKLISLHPWSQMAKLFRTGGEANTAAIRIARAATGKEKILVCGYHGWHDWYLATNLSNKKNLDKMLIGGISPLGVPKKLKGSTIPFNYNDYFQLEKIINKNKKDICAVKMEVERNVPPTENFLKKVRSLTRKKGILLIFDECTSGFRENFGGLHMKYKVYPDLAVFGKALGNGYAISAVIGKKKYMKYADLTFMSSTFWTERIGPTAALKTLEIMEKKKSWKEISKKGAYIKQGWKNLSMKYKIPINIFGLNSLCGFNIISNKSNLYKTLITQEMLKKGFLANNMVYVCVDHTKKIIKKYFKTLDKIFYMISECEKGKNIQNFLEASEAQTSFKRLN